ncbi:MAG: tRNA/rRNA methyltransferase [Oligoflexales bacterium]
MEVCFILVKPQRPANIGACARAMKVMGFCNLRLVEPCNDWDKEQYTAHGSADLLQGAEVFSNLAEAAKDCQLLIGTTARKRGLVKTVVDSRNLSSMLTNKHPEAKKIALVFGCEASGLSNNDLDLCDIGSSIPLRNPYPSCNLAQAVMIYAYEFGLGLDNQALSRRKSFPHPNDLHSLKSKLKEFLPGLGVRPSSTLFKKVMDRLAQLNQDDREIVFCLKNFIDKKLMNK